MRIYYCPYETWDKICNGPLKIGENVYMKEDRNETIFLEQSRSEFTLPDEEKPVVFRIIPQTNYLEGEGQALINIKLKVQWNFDIVVYLTSLENSLGYLYSQWKDGEQLKYTIDKNTIKYVTIRQGILNFGGL